jgi:hypothetical protein
MDLFTTHGLVKSLFLVITRRSFKIRDSRFEIRDSRFEIRDSRFEIRAKELEPSRKVKTHKNLILEIFCKIGRCFLFSESIFPITPQSVRQNITQKTYTGM